MCGTAVLLMLPNSMSESSHERNPPRRTRSSKCNILKSHGDKKSSSLKKNHGFQWNNLKMQCPWCLQCTLLLHVAFLDSAALWLPALSLFFLPISFHPFQSSLLLLWPKSSALMAMNIFSLPATWRNLSSTLCQPLFYILVFWLCDLKSLIFNKVYEAVFCFEGPGIYGGDIEIKLPVGSLPAQIILWFYDYSNNPFSPQAWLLK